AAFGIAPAWMAARADPLDALRGAGRTIGSHLDRAQQGLVVVQAAVSLVLLSASAMLGQSLHNLEHQPFGFDTADRYLVSINTLLSNPRADQVAPLVRDLEDRVREIPGLRMASAALYAPLSGLDWSHAVRIESKPEPGPEDDMSADWTRVTPGFFETLGD